MSHPPVPTRAAHATARPHGSVVAVRSRRAPRSSRLAAAAALALTVLLGHGLGRAQSFNANSYYQQCLRFEAGGDLETARQSCLNALQINPSFVDANLALARIDLELGRTDSAQQRLQQIQDKTSSAEPLVLLAQAAVQLGRYGDADAYLQRAQTRLDKQPNRQLAAKAAYLTGEVDEHQGLYNQALAAYGHAIDEDSLNVDYRLAEARLRFRLGDPATARDQLQAYMKLSGDTKNAQVHSLLGSTLWAMGDLHAAAGQLETALALRSSRDTSAQAGDLRKLALIYYAQGEVQSGGVALREAARRGNLQDLLVSNGLLWLLLLLFLVAVHLVGESRIANTTTLEVVDGPQEWSVGQAYGILVATVLLAALAALVYSLVVYDNALAFLTPLQETDVRAVFLIALSVLLVSLTWRRVSINGWDPFERLLGSGEQAMAGIGLGILLLAAVLGYLAYIPHKGLLGPFYLNLTRLTPLVIVALVLLPLTELFFRAFLIPPLRRRYDASIATIGSAALYGLALFTPVALLFVFGLVLAEVFRRRSNGITPLLAQLVLNVGLVLAVAFSAWARSLFLS
jgi:tetratricopeptide (TPR) repeat protein